MIKFLLKIIRFVNYLLIVAFVFLMGVMFSILYIEDPDYSGTYKNEKNDTEFFTLHKTNLRDSVKNDMGSDELQEIDYNILAKDQEIDNKKQAIEDDLKAMIAKINSDGEAYKVSRQKYVNEKKTFEFTKKKYELGMVSELALRQAELSLKSAEMTNMQNGYQYYLDWQKYYLAERGIDVSALSF